MKINSLLESTVASDPSNATNSAPTMGRSDKFLEEKDETVEECTSSGSVASVDSPIGGMQRRGKGSMFAGISTSDKYPNSKSVKEEQINEVDPRNFDSDVDYYAARTAPAKARSHARQSPGVNQDDEAYFREIFRKKRLAAQQAERSADHDRLATGTNESEMEEGQKWPDNSNSLAKRKPVVAFNNQGVKAGRPGGMTVSTRVEPTITSTSVQRKDNRPIPSFLQKEGEEMGTFAALKDWQVWDVTVMNNYYRGKYADYGARYYSVVASSPEEARQVVLNNADYVLRDLLSRKLQNGKKVLPRGSALPVEEKRVGDAKPGSITTMGFKKMLTPDGVQSFKFTGGKIVDGAHVKGGEEVEEASTIKTKTGLRHSGDYGTEFQPDDARDSYGHRTAPPHVAGAKRRSNSNIGRGRPVKSDGMSTKDLPADPFNRTTGAIPKGNKGTRHGQWNRDEVDEASFDYTMKDLGNDYAGFPSNHSLKHKFLAKIKPEKQQLYKDKMNNMHEFDQLFQLFTVAKQRGDIIEQGVAEEFNPEYDDEAGSAESNLHTIARAAQGLIDSIGDNENLPEWAQEKIAKVEGMLVAVWDYLESQEEQGIDPQVDEDWQKTNKQDKTDGMSPKAVKAYRRENPGSKLKTAVTTKPSKLKAGSKDAKRRKSFCARMSGNKGPMKDEKGRPTPKAKALSRWNCESVEQTVQMLESVQRDLSEVKQRLDPKCWKGYKKQGTKMKGDTRVNNCVKVDEAEFTEDKLAQDLYKDLQIFKKGTDKDIGSKAKDKEISGKAKDKDIVAKEGAKVDRMVNHVKSSEKKLGHSDQEAENIAWATANKRGMLDNKNKK